MVDLDLLEQLARLWDWNEQLLTLGAAWFPNLLEVNGTADCLLAAAGSTVDAEPCLSSKGFSWEELRAVRRRVGDPVVLADILEEAGWYPATIGYQWEANWLGVDGGEGRKRGREEEYTYR